MTHNRNSQNRNQFQYGGRDNESQIRGPENQSNNYQSSNSGQYGIDNQDSQYSRATTASQYGLHGSENRGQDDRSDYSGHGNQGLNYSLPSRGGPNFGGQSYQSQNEGRGQSQFNDWASINRSESDREYPQGRGQSGQQGYGNQSERGMSSGRSGLERSTGSYWGAESGSSAQSNKGRFSGTTPKNFKRSDERIYEEICEKLSDEGHFDISEVEIKVEGGEVTLEGSIESRSDKHRIEILAESVMGVKEITNQLKIVKGVKSSGSRESTSSSDSESSLRSASAPSGKTRSIGSSTGSNR